MNERGDHRYNKRNRKAERVETMKKRTNESKKKEQDQLTVKDTLSGDLFAKLQEKKQQLKAEEQKKQEEAQRKKQEERQQREKNKSFEELLNESNMDWKKFK
ncbi:YqkE family protein [Bacillus thermotolerans]|uniref:YqkE family protein n=1 Tax=Bacillus thermotolerans TaxID=1221996 RepID=UPI000583195A|nr:YqkE family protein [Bacillus thermotolerans]KKB33033.1 hypothetical protein QY97_00349 [Bacillus thermotolerans]KKB36210.1 hypothetical protein QY96_03468 [Bacillus thermotolerans]